MRNTKPVFATVAQPARCRLVPRRAVEEAEDLEEEGNPLFNDAFKGILMEALSRQEERTSYGDAGSNGNGNGAGPAYYDSPSSTYSSNGHHSSNGSSTGYIPDSFATSSFSSYSSVEEEAAPSLQEEVLITALGSSKTTLNQLRLIQKAIDRAIEREEKQVERLEFALQKARTDAAYYNSLEQLNRSKRRSWRDL